MSKKNKILTIVTLVVFFVFSCAICCLDSDTYIPAIMTFLCEIYLGLFLYANKDKFCN